MKYSKIILSAIYLILPFFAVAMERGDEQAVEVPSPRGQISFRGEAFSLSKSNCEQRDKNIEVETKATLAEYQNRYRIAVDKFQEEQKKLIVKNSQQSETIINVRIPQALLIMMREAEWNVKLIREQVLPRHLVEKAHRELNAPVRE